MTLIERRPDVCGGQPVIAGTRVRTETVYILAESGCTVDDILLHYSGLTPAQITAAVRYERRWYRRLRRALVRARLSWVYWAWERWGDG